MVTGEFSFESIFNLEVPPSDYVPVPYLASNFIMWIIFLILIPVILNNMLVSWLTLGHIIVSHPSHINIFANHKLHPLATWVQQDFGTRSSQLIVV